MKRCPECFRDYSDITQNFCLDDGTPLVDGPAVGAEPETRIFNSPPRGETATAVHSAGTSGELVTAQLPSHSRLVIPMVAVAIFSLLALGLYLFSKPPKPQIASIAVMPFVNEGGDPEIEYLADGMTESLIGSLSQIPDLNVKARSSVFRYKGKETDIRSIAKELNVEAILSGRIVPRGGEVALYVELIDASTENVHFKADYLQPLTNLVALQKDLTHDISTRLRATLTAAQQQVIEKTHTQDPEAYRLYLQGRYHWNKREPEEHRKAISYFEQALALDPQYALAYSGMADCYAVDSSPVKGPERFRFLREAAEKALAIDPTLGQPHAALANSYWETFEWASAENSLLTAIRLDPNYATAHQWYAELLSRLARHDEAVATIRRAEELDPLSLIIASDAIYILANARRYDEALAQVKKTQALDAGWAPAMFLESLVHELRGDLPAALDARERQTNMSADLTADQKEKMLAEIRESRKALSEKGAEGFWRKELEFELNDRKRPGSLSPFYIAEIYSHLNDKYNAFRWLDRAIDEKDDLVDLTKATPSFDNLRNDPRWPQALARINLTP